MNKLQMLVKQINKDQGADVITVGDVGYKGTLVPFTSPRLNYILHGGFPSNKAIEIFGPEHGGKTTTALDMVANVQRIEFEKYENALRDATKELENTTNEKQAKLVEEKIKGIQENGPRQCIYLDAENTLDNKWAEKLGVDVDSMILIRPQEQSAEQVMQMMLDLIDTGQVACMVLDSIPMLVPQSIYDEDMTKKAYCGVSGPLSIFCSKIVGMGKLSKNNTMLIGINQVREDIDNPYNQFETPGGRAWRHLAAIRLMVRHGSWFDETNQELANNAAATPAGNKVDIVVVKNKCAKSDRRLGFYRLNYAYGIDEVADMLDLAVQFDLVQKSGSWFQLPGEVKVQGMKAVGEYFNNHPEDVDMLREEVYKRLI